MCTPLIRRRLLGTVFFAGLIAAGACGETNSPQEEKYTGLRVLADSGALLVQQARLLRVEARRDDGSTVFLLPAGYRATSSDPSVASIADGVVTALSAGRARVTVSAGGQSASLAVEVESQPPLANPSRVNIPLDLPTSLARTGLTVSTLGGFASQAIAGNAASLSVGSARPTMTAVARGDDVIAMMVVSPRTPMSSGGTCGQRMGAMSTAVAMMLLDPELATVPTGLVCELVGVISSVPEVTQLAAMLMPPPSGSVLATPNLRGALLNATRAVKVQLRAIGGASVAQQADVPLRAGTTEASGVRFTASLAGATTFSTEVQNRWGREVWLTAREVGDRGEIGSAILQREWLPAADYVPNLASLAGWLSLATLNLGPANPRRLTLPRVAGRQGVRFDAYGIGVRDVSTLQTASDRVQFSGAASASAILHVALPIMSIATGVDFANGKGTFSVTDIEDLSGVVLDVSVAIACLQAGGGGQCLIDGALDKLSEPDVAYQVIRLIARKAGVNLSAAVLQSAIRKMAPWLTVASGIDALASIGAVAIATVNSSVREPFVLTANSVVGARVAAQGGGDGQNGTERTSLPVPLRVVVRDEANRTVQGATVLWSVTGGGGSLSMSTTTTDANGLTEARWTMGTAGPQRAEAWLAGSAAVVSFTATANPLGNGTLSGRVYNFATNIGVANARVDVLRSGALVASTTSGSSGAYRIDALPASVVDLRITATGFVPVDIRQVRVDGDRVLEAIPLVTQSAGVGGISGTLYDASRNAAIAIPGIVRVFTGMNAVSGVPVATASSSTSGSYAIPGLPAGVYTVVVEVPGFAIGSRTGVSVGAGLTTSGQHLFLSASGSASIWRIVLTWGTSPSDLDSHLTVPLASGTRAWVNYATRGSCVASPFACLDVDIRSGRGPETITIAQQQTGVYRYAVHNYSNGNSAVNSVLSISNARVDLYQGNSLVQSFGVPSGAGTLWTVFELQGATIRPINTMSGNPPGPTLLVLGSPTEMPAKPPK